LVAAGEASARIPPLYRNCAALNIRYPHGLGKTTARDKTARVPVRNFWKSNRLFALAMSYDRGLDRDHDGIACEKD
jgi:Excalibur calcium-binding domain